MFTKIEVIFKEDDFTSSQRSESATNQNPK